MVWSQDAVIHSSIKPKVFQEITRILKPGGFMVFSDPMQHEEVDPDVLKPLLARANLPSLGSIPYYSKIAEEAGMRVVKIVETPNGIKNHYSRVLEVLRENKENLRDKISDNFCANMDAGLCRWIDAAEKKQLTHASFLFQKK